MIKLRLARLRAVLKKERLDGLLVTLPANRRYLSGFAPDDGQWGESSGALLITQADAVILTDFRYALSAQEQAPLFAARIYRQGLSSELGPLAKDLRLKRLGFEAEALLVDQKTRLEEALTGVEMVPTRGLVGDLRRVKDPAELEAMGRALAIMEQALGRVLAMDIVGRSERELALMLTRMTEDLGADGPAFPPIVAAGPNGAEPHAEPGERVIVRGEPVIFDVGAAFGGYACDITRTVAAGGLEAANERFREVYPVVRRAQLKAIAQIRPGMSGKVADAIARQVIEEAGFGDNFGHSLGHGVGLNTHETPSLGPGSKDILEPGMVFTIEPGIYLPDWGGVRLEVMVHLTKRGCRVLGGLDWFYEL